MEGEWAAEEMGVAVAEVAELVVVCKAAEEMVAYQVAVVATTAHR